MPSVISGTPFLSLRPDHDCERQRDVSTNGASAHSSLLSPPGRSKQGESGAGPAKGQEHGNLNGISESPTTSSPFLKLPHPQQSLLRLHGPRQKYTLERGASLPLVTGDDEILVQVLAIGLNPVDWKGVDYGFGQPSYPWINGRDFAGIVVKGPERNDGRADGEPRVKQGDVVFGPSTDYRDVRKAAYQEYLVTTGYNVARLPSTASVEEGAAVGVAFVAASIALGVSLGVDFKSLAQAPETDLLGLARGLKEKEVPEDVREEVFRGIREEERPRPGEWVAIWGVSSTSGFFALQLAKLAGLRVAAVADVAKHGARLAELGADLLIDKFDTGRAIEVLRAVTRGQLRFAIDIVGKESASFLQKALPQTSSGPRAHLLGLTGLPKEVKEGVVHHKLPIKLFHEAPVVGETLMRWLEALLLANTLKMPRVDIADGGLAGINAALDRMRNGEISGKRLVVPVPATASQNSAPETPITNGVDGIEEDGLAYADRLNADPDRIKFAYWVPNVSGGLVISKIPQRTNWDLKSNQRYAKTAERVGFEYALSQIRFMAGYGADNQHEPVSFSQALLHSTERLKLIAALLPGPWNPAVAAKQIASIDHYSSGRIAVNVVSGWFKAEFTSIGQWWLDHSERYRRSREFIACLRGIWTTEKFSFSGDFYQFHDYPLKPKPLVLPDRPHPEIFQGGNSDDARENAAQVSDYYFMNGNTLEGFQAQIRDVKERAKKAGREGKVKFALNGFVICRDTEAEAVRVLQEIQGKADAEAVEGFRQQVQNAGASTANKTGMWANSKFEDLVQYNDGFKTRLIGTKDQIADRILLLKSLGVDVLLTAFLHYEEEIKQFGDEVLPLVRKLEKEGRGKDQELEIKLTGEVYRDKM